VLCEFHASVSRHRSAKLRGQLAYPSAQRGYDCLSVFDILFFHYDDESRMTLDQDHDVCVVRMFDSDSPTFRPGPRVDQKVLQRSVERVLTVFAGLD
jgi:hypothetical protein